MFTSAVDQTLTRLFESGGRNPEVVLTATETPRVARSKTRPPLHYLFGSAGFPHPYERPPADRTQLNTRRIRHAVPLLSRVLDTTTTLGVVAVEGLVHGQDWLKIDDFLGAVGNAAPAQVLWFGVPPHVASDYAEDFAAAIESGRIVLERDHLGTVVAELRTRGRLPAATSQATEAQGIITIADGKTIETTPELRLRVEAVASIVDDSWMAFLPPLGPDSGHAAFRRFHGSPGSPRFLVEGIRRDFAIERRFEADLQHRVFNALADHASIGSPIVVHGQSGTGKSMALARVVARVRESKVAAVLYSVYGVPQAQEIAAFCELSERAGSTTLVVCDANRGVDSYHDLLMSLRSQGRRVVVLGSQYRIAEHANQRSASDVLAPVELSQIERRELSKLLETYLDEGPRLGIVQNANILALLYRCLPSSRPRIGTGLAAEARSAQRRLVERGRRIRRSAPSTQIAQQLIKAGLPETYQLLLSDQQNDTLNAQDASGRLVDLVMVSGSLTCPVPINLLLRAVTDAFPELDIVAIAELFRDLDLFRWRWADGEHSELLVSPRLALEAQIICRRRLGGVEAEAAFVLALIGATRNTGVDRDYEQRFLLALLRQVGVDGPRGNDYRSAYARIGRCLTTLRERFGVYHPSLVLQESAFRRIAVRQGVVADSDRLPLLEEARDAVQLALDDIASGEMQASKRTRRMLEVERASVYGYLSIGLVRQGAPSHDVWSSYEAARVAIRRAVSVNDNYYPFDIGLWTPADLLTEAELTTAQRCELEADIYATLAQVNPETLRPAQREKFEIRTMRVGATLADRELTDGAYDALEASGSTAGYFLRAREMAPQFKPGDVIVGDQHNLRRAGRAATFLLERMNRIEEDERCLSLLLECRWVVEMERRLLRGSRQPLPAADSVRREFLAILRALNQASGEAARYVTRYLEAVLAWTTEDEHQGIQNFRDLGRDTEHDDPGRVVRRHVIAEEDGTPRPFRGRIERQRSEGHWVVRVEGLGRKVDLLSRDFPHEEIVYGRTIANFSVAFNYIGPIADPIKLR